MIRVLVTGGRNYADKARVHRVLDRLAERLGIFELIEGGATGADRHAQEWANSRMFPLLTCPITNDDWKLYGKRAGRVRNEKMIRLKPTLVVAFPGGAGTKHMKSITRRDLIRLLEITDVHRDQTIQC